MSALPFEVAKGQHRLLGEVFQLRIPPALELRLIPAEAQSLSRALAAVRDGRSPEKELFMSPMGSNGLFTARVGETGIAVDAGGSEPTALGWEEVGALAKALGGESA